MWDGLFILLSFSIVMGAASFLAGSLPLSFGLSQNHSRIISAIGTGLLVGTCLIIIVPEGIETLYSAAPHDPHSHKRQDTETLPAEALYEPHAWVGASLIAGFLLMYLIDQVPRHASSITNKAKPLHISLANLSQGPHHAIDDGEGADNFSSAFVSTRNSSTTIGLVIHAAADGIALAASSFISESSTGFVVFLALMIHKAPAAFGLTSVLLKQGFSKRHARAHLIVFSLAAPLGAIATFIGVNLLAGGHIQGEAGTRFVTGLLLLFSGGTFLYVAMHTMQDQSEDSHDAQAEGYMNESPYAPNRLRPRDDSQPQIRDMLLTCLGMLVPLLAQAGHGH